MENKILGEVIPEAIADATLSKNHSATEGGALKQNIQKGRVFEINRFFNELPIRIIGTHEYPCFYADDIGAVLKLKRVRKSLENFGPREIVTRDQRENMGLVTYGRDGKKYDRIILLTEFGVYRLMFTTHSQLAEQFRDWVYDVLHELRMKGRYEVEAELQKLRITDQENKTQIKKLLAKQEQFKNLADTLYLFEVPHDPTRIVQRNTLPEDSIDDDDVDFPPEYNRIDNLELYLRINPDGPSQHTYKITSSPTPNDHSRLAYKHKVWVKEASKSFARLQRELSIYEVDSLPGTYYYACGLEKIIATMNAVADE